MDRGGFNVLQISGLRITVSRSETPPFRDADGPIAHLTFPPGAQWKTSTGPKWTFKDKASGATLKVQFDAKQGIFALTAKVKSATLTDPDADSIVTAVVIGEDAFLNTQLWELDGKITTP